MVSESLDSVQCFVPDLDLQNHSRDGTCLETRSFAAPCTLLLCNRYHYTRLEVSAENGTQAVLFNDIQDIVPNGISGNTPTTLQTINQYVTLEDGAVSISPLPRDFVSNKPHPSYKLGQVTIEVYDLPMLNPIAFDIDQHRSEAGNCAKSPPNSPKPTKQHCQVCVSEDTLDNSNMTKRSIEELITNPPTKRRGPGRPRKNNLPNNKTPQLMTKRYHCCRFNQLILYILLK